MFNNNRTETRTFFLKTSSCNFERKTSNSDFVVHASHTPVELNHGVTGVSLVSATFPQNQSNVTDGKNVLRYSFTTSANNSSLTVVAVTDTFEWRRKATASSAWSSWYTHIASAAPAAETGVFTDTGTFVTALNTNFKNSYTTAFPSASAGDVEFDLYNDFTGLVTAIQNKSIILFRTFSGVIVEFKQSSYLTKIGIDVSAERPNGYNVNAIYLGVVAPTAHVLTITPGQYTVEDISALILADLDTTNPGGYYDSLGEISDNDQRLRLDTNLASETVVFWGTDFGSSIGPSLGISDGVDADIDGVTFDTTFSYVANLHGPMVVYLHSQLLAGRTTLDGDTGGIVSIVKQIPIVAGYRELQVYNNDDNGVPDISFPLSRRKHFSEIDITLKDQHGNLLDLGSGSLEVMWKL